MTTGTLMPDEPVAEHVGDEPVCDGDVDVVFVLSTVVVKDGDCDYVVPITDSPTTLPDSPILLVDTPSIDSDEPMDQNTQHHRLDIGVTGEDVESVEHTQPNPEQSWQYDPAGEFWRLGLAKLKVFSRSSNIMLQLFSFIYIIFKSIISGTQVH